MKNKFLILAILASSLIISCGDKSSKSEEKTDGDQANSEINDDASKMCECFKAGLNDSKKYMECSDENAKIREKYMKDPEQIKQYEIALNECMK